MLAVIECIIIIIFGIMYSTVADTMIFTVYVAVAVIFTIIIVSIVGIFAIIQIVLLIGIMFLL